MPPVLGVCFDFQFGKCNHPTHHQKSDGELELHICQPCYQVRQMLVHHSCSGQHPCHGGGAGERHVGALGCPAQVSHPPPAAAQVSSSLSTTFSSPSSQTQHAVRNDMLPYYCPTCGKTCASCSCVTYPHKPDALCTCESCRLFVNHYQITLDNLRRQSGQEELDLYSYYYDYHSEDDSDTDSDVDTVVSCQDTDWQEYETNFDRWDDSSSVNSFSSISRQSLSSYSSTPSFYQIPYGNYPF